MRWTSLKGLEPAVPYYQRLSPDQKEMETPIHIKNDVSGSTAGAPLENQTRIDDDFAIFYVHEYIIMPKAVLTRPKISG